MDRALTGKPFHAVTMHNNARGQHGTFQRHRKTQGNQSREMVNSLGGDARSAGCSDVAIQCP